MSKTPAVRFEGFTEDWEPRKIGNIGEVVTGSTPSTHHPEYYSEDGIPWVTPTDIIKNVTSDTPKKLSHLGAQVGRVVPAETILVTCIASIGKNTMLAKTGSFNQQINGLVPDKQKYNPYFLLTESYHWSEKMKREAAAGTMQIVNKNDFSAIETFVPELLEQQFIGYYFQQLDNFIALHQSKYEKLVNIKKSMLYKMFPQNGRKVPEMRFKGFTDDWEQRKLGDIVGIYDGVHQTPNYQNSGVMFLSVENIATLKSSKFISEEDFKRDYKVYPQENDILMTRIGDVGTTNVVTDNGLKAYYVSLALLKYKSTDPYFLSNAIQSDYVQKGLANRTLKTAIPMKINKDDIGKVSVMLPLSATEQQQIGTYFSNLDNLITLHQRKLEKLKQIKQALLHKMFV